MSSSSSKYCEGSNFIITPIPDLIELFKHLFRRCQVDEVHNILVDREKKMKVELENIEKEKNLLKHDCLLLRKMRSSSISEREKSKLLKKLVTSQRECQELKEKIMGLNEKNEKVAQIGIEHEELKRRLTDANETIEIMRRDKLEQDRMEDQLRRQNLETSETIEMLRRQISEAKMEKKMSDEIMNEMMDENSNALRTIEELKRGKLEAEEVVERLGRKIAMVGEGLENILKLDERDLASIVKPKEEKLSGSKEAEGMNLPRKKGEKQTKGKRRRI